MLAWERLHMSQQSTFAISPASYSPGIVEREAHIAMEQLWQLESGMSQSRSSIDPPRNAMNEIWDR
jgi:hypothetical protein